MPLVRRINPPRLRTVPPWDLPTVLRALKGPPFEPLQSSSLRVLSLKTALLLALASVKQVGDLQALSVNSACLEFGPNDSKVVLKPRLGYVPKVLSTLFRELSHNFDFFVSELWELKLDHCVIIGSYWRFVLIQHLFIVSSFLQSVQ